MQRKIKKILDIITPSDKKKLILIIFLVVIMALLEMIGVASIMPFMSVLVEPELIQKNSNLNYLFQISNTLGIENSEQFLFLLGVVCFLLILLSISFKGLTIYIQTMFNVMARHNTAIKLVEGYLSQPYTWFLNRHSSELSKNILAEVKFVIDKGLASFMNLITQIIVSIVLISLLLIVNFKLTLVVGCSLAVIYYFIFIAFKKFNTRIGQEREKANTLCFSAMYEAFGAYKEVKVLGLEQFCVDRFSHASYILSRHSASTSIVSLIPRLIIEAFVFCGIILLILYLMLQSNSLNDSLPVLSLFAFTCYRLIPALQGIYISFNQLVFAGAGIDKMHKDFRDFTPIKLTQVKNSISFEKNIILENLSFNYPNAKLSSLKNINLEISANSTVGFVGKTGSGKTTLIDTIIGLLETKVGKLKVDGIEINKENYKSWQNIIGYAPQQIYLADTTITANIAFGYDLKNIDIKAVEHASKIANIHNFISEELPLKYNTIVGERGVKLSGGQRQRIGIARAIYHNPRVLILDEATSSLDNITEQAVMRELSKLKKKMTIIIIAHRLSTLKSCDKIFHLENGKLIKQGKFEEIITNDNQLKIKYL